MDDDSANFGSDGAASPGGILAQPPLQAEDLDASGQLDSKTNLAG
jgi:hypothetical protein